MVGRRYHGEARRQIVNGVNLIFGQDQAVSNWLVETQGCHPLRYDLAVGLALADGTPVGGIMYTGYNGSDVEVHFYGPKHLTRRIVRWIFLIAIKQFNVNRVTVRTRKKHMARGVRKLGAIYEGTVKRLYGPTDSREHSAQQFAFFRDQIEILAGLRGRKHVRIST